jgi:2,4-dienoyl-CoA reductase-like NADH-dependent reductase (Old Yellow Enzyme family)
MVKLLTPIQVGPIELKNRVVSTAHAAFLDFFQEGASGERYMAYLERRAEGGAGMIILTAMHVHESSQVPNHFVFRPEVMAPKFQKVSARLHRHGARAISQLFHFGAQGKSDSHDDFHPLWSFSGATTLSGEATHEMTSEEIEEVIESFVRAATTVVTNGMDGVELHGTHGYLIQQSFSPSANRRTDKWGEDLYFVKVLAQRVRDAIGPDKVMGFRISGDDYVKPDDGGIGHERLCRIASEVIGTGLFDYLNHSEGSGGADYAKAIGSYRYPFGEYLPLTRNLREAIGGAVPLIGVGKIPTPDLAEQALQDGDCDLVGMTRAQIADPDLVKKLETGQGSRIRTCTGSNQGCIDRVSNFPITCFQNPEVGEENRFKALDVPITAAKRVLVVGGGPAGMKAAEIAARRGHEVTLVEAGSKLGGRLNLVETLGAATNLLSSTAWIEQELSILKVKILTQTTVDEAFVQKFKPDAIILATGAIATNELGVATDGSIQILSSDDTAAGLFEGIAFEMQGTRSLMIDQRANYETALVAESLAKRASKVTVATPHLYFGVNMGQTHLNDYLRLLPKLGIDVLPTTIVDRISRGRAHLKQAFSGEVTAESFDFIVAGVPPKPQDSLLQMLRGHAPTTMVGDAVAPRSAMEAFREGDRAGRTV